MIRNRAGHIGAGLMLVLCMSGLASPAQAAVLTVRPTDLAPQTAFQGQPFIPVLRLDLSVDVDWVRVDWIRIDKTGNMPDEDIAAVQIWFDADADFVFDPTRDVLLNTRVNLWPDRLLLDGRPDPPVTPPDPDPDPEQWDPRREYPQPITEPGPFQFYTSLAYVGMPPLEVPVEERIYRAVPGNFLGLAANGDDVINQLDSDGNRLPAVDPQGTRIPAEIRRLIRRGSVILDGFNTDYDNSFDPYQSQADGNGVDPGTDEIPLPVLSDDPLYQRKYSYNPGNPAFSDMEVVVDERLAEVDNRPETRFVNRVLVIESGFERSFFIVYSLASDATLGTHVGARLADPSYIQLDESRDPSRPFGDLVSSDNFPIASGQISPRGSEVRVSGENLAPPDLVGGRIEQGMARFTLAVNHGRVRVDSITVHDEGDAPNLDVTAVKLFQDHPAHPNGRFDPIGTAVARDVYLQAVTGRVDRTTLAPPSPVLEDPEQSFIPNALVGHTLTIRNGPPTEARSRYTVISNTVTSITVDRPIEIDPFLVDNSGNPVPVEYSVAFERGFTGDGDGDDRATTFTDLDILLEQGRPVTFLVVYDITGDPGAYGHRLRARVSEGDITLTTAAEDAVIMPPGGIQSGESFIRQRVVRLVATDAAPTTVVQGKVTTPMLQVQLTADSDAVAGPSVLTALTVHKTGTSTDANGTSDVSRIRVFHDVNGNAVADEADVELTDTSQTLLYPLSGTVQTLPLVTPLSIAPGSTEYLLITYDFNPLANTNVALGVALTDVQMVPPDAESDLTFDPTTPTILPASNLPLESTQTVIVEQLLVTTESLAPRVVAQGDRAVLMEKLTLEASPNPAGNAAVTLKSITANKIGTNPRNEDAPFVRLFRDVVDRNGNGRVEEGEGQEVAFASMEDGKAFLEDLNLNVQQGSPRELWLALDISATAATETTVGLRIPRPDQMPVVLPDKMDEDVFPITSTVATIGNTLRVQGDSLAPSNAAPGQEGVVVETLTFTTDTKDIAVVGLRVTLEMRDRFGLLDPENPPQPEQMVSILGAFRDVKRNGRVDPEDDSLGLTDFGGRVFRREGAIFTAATDLILAAPSGGDFIVNVDRAETVLLVANIAHEAFRGVDLAFRLEGVDPTDPYSLHDASEAPSGLPNAVQVRFPNNVSGENFPFASEGFRIGEGLRVTGASLVPSRLYRTQVGVPFLRLKLTAQPGDVILQRLGFERKGSAPDDAVSSLRLYYDADGDGQYRPDVDTQQLGNEQTFAGGLAVFDLTGFDPAQRLVPGGKSRTLFVVGDIAEGIPPGETLGVHLTKAEDIQVNPQAAVIDENFPITGLLATIGDGLRVERMPLQQDPPMGNRVGRGRETLALLHLRLTALTGPVTLTGMRVNKVGGQDSDVAGVQIFEDTSGDGVFSVSQANPAQNDTPLGSVRRFGEEGFPGRVHFTSINLAVNQGAPKDLFVVVDVDPNSERGRPLLVEVQDARYLELQEPDVVIDLPDQNGDGLPDPIESGQVGTLTAPPSADFRTLTDDQAAYEPDQWKDAALVARRNRKVQGETLVTSNTAQTLTVDPPLTQVQQGDEYLLGPSIDINRLTVSAVSLAGADVPSLKVEQGQDSIRMMQLKLETNAGSILIRSLKVRLTGTGAVANDVVRVRLMEDVNGNGEIDAGIDLDAAQPQKFSTSGFAVFTSLNETVKAGKPLYLLLVYDVSAAARAGHQLQVALGDGDPTHVSDFVIVAGDDKVELTQDPLESEAIAVTGNTLEVTAGTLAPPNAAIGANHVPMMFLRFSNQFGTVLVQGLQVTAPSPTVGAAARLIRRVRVFDDAGRDGIIGGGDVEVARTTEFPFVGRTQAELLFQPYTVEAGTPRQVIVAYDIAEEVPSPSTADTVGAQVQEGDLLVEDPPDRVSPDFQGFQSDDTVIGRMLIIEGQDADPIPTLAARGERVHVGTLILTPRTRVDGPDLILTDPIVLRELRLSLKGTAQDRDLTGVRLVREELDGEIELGQASFTGGRATFTFSSDNEIREATTVRVEVEVSSTAAAGRTFTLTLEGAEAALVDAPDFTALSGRVEFPSEPLSLQGNVLVAALQSEPKAPARAPQGARGLVMGKIHLRTPQGQVSLRDLRVDRIGVGSTDADVAVVKLYRDWTDANGNGRIEPSEGTLLGSGVFSSGAMTIRGLSLTVVKGTPVDVYLTFDMAEGAALGAEVGLRIADETYFRVDAPNVIATHDPDTQQVLFPMTSRTSRVSGNLLQVTAIAGRAELQTPVAVQQGRLGVRLLGLQLQVDSGTAVVNRVRIRNPGTALAEEAISAFRLFEWRSADNRFQADQDVLVQLGSVPFGGLSDPQEAEIQQLNIEVQQGRPVKLVLAYDLKPQAPVGQTVGVSLPSNGYLGVRSPDIVEAFADVTGDGRPDPLPTPPQTITLEAAPGALHVEGFNIVPGSSLEAGVSGSVVQGQGNVPFLLLRLQTTSRVLHLVSLEVTEIGTVVAATGVVQVKLFEFPGTTPPTAEDLASRTPLTAAVFSPTSETTQLRGFNVAVDPNEATPKQLVLAADIGPNPPPGETVGFMIPSPAALTLREDDATVQDFPDGPIQSAQPTIRRSAFSLQVEGQSLVPANVNPGQAHVAFLRLDLSTAAGNITMNGLAVEKVGSLGDEQVESLRLFLDRNRNGQFEPGSDSQVGSSTRFSVGVARFENFQLEVTPEQPRSLFLVVDLRTDAILGETLGIRVPFEDPQNPDHTAVRVVEPDLVSPVSFPLASGVATVRNAILVSGFDVAPVEASQGTDFLALLGLQFSTVSESGNVYRLIVRQGGTATDDDVDSMRLYVDSNGSRQFEPGSDQPLRGPVPVEEGVATFDLTDSPLAVEVVRPVTLFVVVQLADDATSGRRVSVRVNSGEDVIVNDPQATTPPATFATGGFPLTSGLTRIGGSLVTVSGIDLAPPAVTAGQTNVPFLALVLEPESGTALLRSILARRIGGTDDADVARLRLHRDEDQNGQFDPSRDAPIIPSLEVGLSNSLAAFSDLNLPLQEGQAVRLFLVGDINPQAPIGRVMGFRIDRSEDVRVALPDGVANLNFPLQSGVTTVGGGLVVAGVTVDLSGNPLAPDTAPPGARNLLLGMLTFTATEGNVTLSGLTFEVIGSLEASQIARVRLFRDSNGNRRYDAGVDLQAGEGGQISEERVTFTGLKEAVSATAGPLPLLVVVDLANDAAVGRTLGLALPDQGAVQTVGINAVSAANFPISTDLILVSTGLVTVTGTDLAPAAVRPGETNVSLLRLDFEVGGGGAVLKGLQLERLGEGDDADVAAVRLHIDGNRNGQFDPGQDPIVGRGAFQNGVASFRNVNEDLPGGDSRSFFVVIDVASGASLGRSFGVVLPRPGVVQVAAPMEVAGTNFPISSGISGILETVRYTAPAGISMISVPTNPVPATAPEVLGVAAATLKMARWDPITGAYRTDLTDPFVGEFRLGEAYWVSLPQAIARDVAGVPATLGQPYAITVQPGWNMVGHPWPFAVPWGEVQVRNGTTTLSLLEAHRQGWISAFAWTYPAGGPYLLIHPTASQGSRLLVPGQGYWVLVRAGNPVELLIPPTAASSQGQPSRQQPSREEWQVKLVARVGDQSDVGFVGFSSEAMQAPDPPAAPGAEVELYVIPGPEDGVGRAALDLRVGAAQRQVWRIAVQTAQAGQEVTLSWPDLGVSLPEGQRMMLLDLDSGERRFLSTTSSFRFRSSEGPRQFELVYEPAGTGSSLVISNLTFRASRAAGPGLLGFHLNGDAATTIEIVSLNGRPVRLIEEQVGRSAGNQKVLWAFEDERGVPVPNGPYLVRITAIDPEGLVTQAVRMITVQP